jgi:hypothetical protein
VNSCLPAFDSFCASNATIQSNPVLDSSAARELIIIHDDPGSAWNRDLYFFRFFKEHYSRKTFSDQRSKPRMPQLTPERGWLKVMVEVNGIEPMTSCLQSRRSPN